MSIVGARGAGEDRALGLADLAELLLLALLLLRNLGTYFGVVLVSRPGVDAALGVDSGNILPLALCLLLQLLAQRLVGRVGLAGRGGSLGVQGGELLALALLLGLEAGPQLAVGLGESERQLLWDSGDARSDLVSLGAVLGG